MHLFCVCDIIGSAQSNVGSLPQELKNSAQERMRVVLRGDSRAAGVLESLVESAKIS